MRILFAKLWRDILRERVQFLAVSATIFLGVLLFAASYGAYQNLKGSYDATFDSLRFPDLWVSGGDLVAFASAARAAPATAAAEVRRAGEIGVRVGGASVLRGQALSLPDSGEPDIAGVLVGPGQPLDGAEAGVLVERHFADHFALKPGDTIELSQGETWRRVTVQGVAVSAEYLWPARTRQDILTPPDDFGVVFLPAGLAAQFELPRQALVRLTPEAPGSALTRLKELAQKAGATDIYGRDEQPSNAALQEDVSGFKELAWLFPFLFLSAAGITTYIVLNRMVQAQRANIGMFRAHGMPTRELIAHYMGYGLVPGVIAGASGTFAGVILGGALTHLYTGALSIPLTVTHVEPLVPVVGLGAAIAVSLAATAVPAWSASRLQPALAMRGGPGAGLRFGPCIERALRPVRLLPLRVRLVLRNITRAPLRSLSIVVGVILALTLVIISWGMIDSINFVTHRQFDQIARDDARVFFSHPVTNTDLSALESLGVARSEPMADLQVAVRSGTSIYQTELLAFEDGTQLRGFHLESGAWVTLPDHGALFGQVLRDRLGMTQGDTVQLLISGGTTALSVQVAEFVDEPLGAPVYLSIEELRRSAAEVGIDPGTLVTAAALRFAPGTDPIQVRTQVSAQTGVQAYVDTKALKDSVDSLLGFFYVIVGLMLAFSAVLAFALIFNTASVALAERRTEVATLLASGMGYWTVGLLVVGENLLVTALGIAPGLGIAWLAGRAFLATFNTDLFRFVWHPGLGTLVLSTLALQAVAVAAQAPGMLAIRRLDIASIIRERAT